jgi:hypothetical protein
MAESGYTYIDGRNGYWSKVGYNTETCTCEERVRGCRSIVIVSTYA